MILSTEQRFIFIHVPKAAGTSVHGALSHLDVFHSVRKQTPAARRAFALAKGLPEAAADFKLHTTVRGAIEVLGRAAFDSYYSFGFVRNPWDVAVSWFHFRLYTSHIAGHREAVEAGTFDAYVHRVLAGPDGAGLVGRQYPFVVDGDGKVALRYVGRYEELRRNFADVVAALNLSALPLDHFNQSHHAPWQSLYTPKTFAVVAAHVGRDADLFGYSRDPRAYGIV